MGDLIRRYAMQAVPRYTSYPTAPHWTAGFAEATWREWLGSLDPRREVSLYLHVPFCRRMCWYCGCTMQLAARPEPAAGYAATLRREIELVAGILPGRLRVGHLHWGGGTPTALAPADLAETMETIRRHFDLVDGAELRWRAIRGRWTHRWRVGGPARLHPGELRGAGVRRTGAEGDQPDRAARDGGTGVDRLLGAGVGAINFDLIHGLPHQTDESLLETVRIANGIGPDRIALFGYAQVPWRARDQRMIPADALPGVEGRATQALRAGDALVEAGFEAVGLDHFARPDDALAVAAREGLLRRNFQRYTADQAATLIGFGASSISSTDHGFVRNETEIGAWSIAVGLGRLPVARGIALRGEDRLRRAAIEWLICQGTVDTVALASGFGVAVDWADDALERLRPMVTDGLVEVEDGQVTMTQAGRPFTRVAAAAFDTYLAARTARQGVAV